MNHLIHSVLAYVMASLYSRAAKGTLGGPNRIHAVWAVAARYPAPLRPRGKDAYWPEVRGLKRTAIWNHTMSLIMLAWVQFDREVLNSHRHTEPFGSRIAWLTRRQLDKAWGDRLFGLDDPEPDWTDPDVAAVLQAGHIESDTRPPRPERYNAKQARAAMARYVAETAETHFADGRTEPDRQGNDGRARCPVCDGRLNDRGDCTRPLANPEILDVRNAPDNRTMAGTGCGYSVVWTEEPKQHAEWNRYWDSLDRRCIAALSREYKREQSERFGRLMLWIARAPRHSLGKARRQLWRRILTSLRLAEKTGHYYMAYVSKDQADTLMDALRWRMDGTFEREPGDLPRAPKRPKCLQWRSYDNPKPRPVNLPIHKLYPSRQAYLRELSRDSHKWR